MRDFLKVALWVIVMGSILVHIWLSTEGMKRAREAGYPFWRLTTFTSLRMLGTKELTVYWIAVAVTVAGVAMGFLSLGISTQKPKRTTRDGKGQYPSLERNKK
jgi:TRAP-type C4-dicarboxylate transport system permease small subunit